MKKKYQLLENYRDYKKGTILEPADDNITMEESLDSPFIFDITKEPIRHAIYIGEVSNTSLFKQIE